MDNIGSSIVAAIICGMIAFDSGRVEVPGTGGFLTPPDEVWSFTLWTGIWAVVGMLVLVEGTIARRKGNCSIPARLLYLPGQRWSDKKIEKTNFGELIVAAVVGYVAYKAVEKTYLFLKDVSLEALDESARIALERFQVETLRHLGYRDRLNRAEELLEEGEIASIDCAAFLAASTLEAGLKSLRDQHDVVLNEEESRGMKGLATALRREGVISPSEYRRIEKHSSIRNIVMHGGTDEVEKQTVEGEIAFAREFLEIHHLA